MCSRGIDSCVGVENDVKHLHVDKRWGPRQQEPDFFSNQVGVWFIVVLLVTLRVAYSLDIVWNRWIDERIYSYYGTECCCHEDGYRFCSFSVELRTSTQDCWGAYQKRTEQKACLEFNLRKRMMEILPFFCVQHVGETERNWNHDLSAKFRSWKVPGTVLYLQECKIL